MVKQAQLARWLKGMTVIVGVLGALFAFLVLPAIGNSYAHDYPDLANLFWPYLIWAWVTAVPCFIVLILFWKICHEISKDNSFCRANSKNLLTISRLILLDTVVFFTISIALFVSNMLHPGLLIATFFVDVCGVGLSMIFAVLSHWVDKACDLKETDDLTV